MTFHIPHHTAPSWEEFPQHDAWGHDLASMTGGSLEECKALCLTYSSDEGVPCTAVTYDSEWGTCYLKACAPSVVQGGGLQGGGQELLHTAVLASPYNGSVCGEWLGRWGVRVGGGDGGGGRAVQYSWGMLPRAVHLSGGYECVSGDEVWGWVPDRWGMG